MAGCSYGDYVVSPRFATLKAIKMCDGRSIEDTRRIVDSSEIDGNGFLKAAKV
jgi:hypothetical protein